MRQFQLTRIINGRTEFVKAVSTCPAKLLEHAKNVFHQNCLEIPADINERFVALQNKGPAVRISVSSRNEIWIESSNIVIV